MIHLAVKHIVQELKSYLNLRSGFPTGDPIVAGSLFNLNQQPNERTKNKIVLSLVNLQEDRVYRSVDVFNQRPDGTSELVKPEVKVNVFILFVANFDDYEEAMKGLMNVVAFFQHRQVFDFSVIPDLADREGRMTFELFSPTFEQQNHLWGALGAKYTPSVIYKAGIFDIRDEQIEALVPPVEEVLINE